MASTLKIHKKHYIAYGWACNLAFDYILLLKQSKLVGGFNPFQTKNSQIGAFPQVGMKLNKYLKPPPSKHSESFLFPFGKHQQVVSILKNLTSSLLTLQLTLHIAPPLSPQKSKP